MRPGRWLVLATILSGLAMSSDPAADQPMTGLAPFEIFADGFRDPRGIAVNANGSVFVADRKAGTVTRIANHTRTVIASGLQRPIGLAFDPAGHLLIAEEKAGRVVRVEANGQRSPVIVNVKQPRWLAVHENGTVFVSARRLTRLGRRECGGIRGAVSEALRSASSASQRTRAKKLPAAESAVGMTWSRSRHACSASSSAAAALSPIATGASSSMRSIQ